ncbi:hypothetical protein FRC03_003101 [Tulasnella sp. 419]|nr:hypothetical protein FRC03_003101 [Tulasnella sp. 419]
MPLSLFPPLSPSLPDFSTLLIKGEYPPTSPIHLCLSHLQELQLFDIEAGSPYEMRKALIICCDEERRMVDKLQLFDDEWLNINAGLGDVAHFLSRIDILYAPTVQRLSAILSLLRPSVTLMGGYSNAEKMVLDPPPSLVILQDPSNYFMDEGLLAEADTLSDYLTIVLDVMSCAKYLCSGQSSQATRVQFALFDSKLGGLRLPIVPKIQEEVVSHRNEEEDNSSDSTKSTEDEEDASMLVDGYFEWVGRVKNVYTSRYDDDAEAMSPPELEDLHSTHYMKLIRHRAYGGLEVESVYMEWRQEDGDENVWTGQSGTRFRWAAAE